MTKKEIKRIYTMADAKLKTAASLIIRNIIRDKKDFKARNITDERITAYQQLINRFDLSTTDEEYRGYVTIAVMAKHAIVQELLTALRNIRNMAAIQFNKTGKYLLFGFDDMNRLNDSDLYRMSRRVWRIGTATLAELREQGLTEALLQQLFDKGSNLDEAIANVGAANEKRDLETQDRIAAGKALYRETMKLTSIGQTFYLETNEAKYNDYLLYDSEGKAATLPDEEEEPENGRTIKGLFF